MRLLKNVPTAVGGPVCKQVSVTLTRTEKVLFT